MTDLFWEPGTLAGVRISVIDNFVSGDECDAIVARARPHMQAATHAGDNGELNHKSKARDSQQAVVGPRKKVRDDVAARVQARSAALANVLSGYNLTSEGQEELMAIQYLEGQQYHLHCDGSCDGSPFLEGGRLATVLMYCEVADRGGATSFPNAGVHVRPVRGQAVYFHFRGPSQRDVMEDWHTEHSGCPVDEGEKWVVTQWLRDGVTAAKPAYKFSPFGGPIGASR